MSKPIGVLGVNQLWDQPPYRHIKAIEAKTGCRTRKYRRVGPRLVQEIRGPETDGPLGFGNAIPFAHVANKLLKPHPLHYAIPACGAHGRLLRCSDVNQNKQDARNPACE